jgi:hypothetical protein
MLIVSSFAFARLLSHFSFVVTNRLISPGSHLIVKYTTTFYKFKGWRPAR